MIPKKIKLKKRLCHKYYVLTYFDHSHKKRKGSLETLDELAVLRTYATNQATLETILFYRISKCKQTKEQGSKDCL